LPDHVVDAGDVDVRLPEAFSADPREVRIGDHKAAAVGGVFAADAEAVRAGQRDLLPERFFGF